MMKQKVLLEQDKHIFRAADLSVLWQITNKNTLLTTIKRYVQNRILYRVTQGVYSTMPLNKLHPFELGCALCGAMAYVSLETILAKEGVISQQPAKITLVGKKNTEIKTLDRTYVCRYMNPQKLVDRTGIVDDGRMAVATVDRAKQDMRYYNPRYHYDSS